MATLTEILVGVLLFLAGVLLRPIVAEILPDEIKERLLYFARRLKKLLFFWKRYKFKVISKYVAENDTPLDEVTTGIEETFPDAEQTLQGYELASALEETSTQIELSTALAVPPEGEFEAPGGGAVQVRETQQVHAIRIVSEIRVGYLSIRDSLTDARAEHQDIGGSITPLGFSASTYSVRCSLPSRTYLQHFINRLRTDMVRSESEEGLEVEMYQDKLVVRSDESGQLSEVINLAIGLIKFYG